MQTLFINGRFLSQKMTGVQRYCWELLNSIDELISLGRIPHKYIIKCIAPKDIIYEPQWKNIELLKIGRFVGNIWEQFNLPYFSQKGLLFSPSNIGPLFHPRQIVTIHDASVFAVPWSYDFLFRTKYQLLLKFEVAHSLHIITDSTFSKDEIIKYISGIKEKISTVYLGGDHLNDIFPDNEILIKNKLDQNKFFLVVGSKTGHKNHNLISSLSDSFPSFLFILVGYKNRIFRNNTDFTSSEKIHDLGYITDNELKSLYQNAKALIFPSIYEGFGFPILEALECGCPVFASNAASIPEVGGNYIQYFDPNNPQSAIEVIRSNVEGLTNNWNPFLDYSQHLAKFKWSDTAMNTWSVIKPYLN